MSDTRLTLCLPIDTTRLFDSTVTQAQLQASTFQNSGDDTDLLASWIEDAEDEFRQQTKADMRVGRVGVAGQRETYEEVTYSLSGHQQFKRNFSGVTSDYLPQEVTTNLENNRVLPFDPDEGDDIYIYRGLSGQATAGSGEAWEDISDEYGESWLIVDHANGELVFGPTLLYESRRTARNGISMAGRGQLPKLRVAVSYRYGGLGGSRTRAAQTTLADALDASETGTVPVESGSGFPSGNSPGTVVVLIDREYVEVNPDPENDAMEVVSRGVRGTSEGAHESGARVQYTPPSVRKAVASKAGMALISSSQYRGWLADTEAELDESDLLEQLEATWDATVEAMS